MKVLELFFGNGSFSRSCLDLGYEVTGVGIDPCPKDLEGLIIYYQMDVLDFLEYVILTINEYHIIWISPPCETYSIAAIRHGLRKECLAVTDKARLHDSYVIKSLEIIEVLKPEYWIIENPRACLRKQPFMEGIPRVTVTYCQYGKDRMKPTDLFGILPEGFIAKACKNGAPCHIASPRGSKHNTDATIPYDLCYELAELMKQ